MDFGPGTMGIVQFPAFSKYSISPKLFFLSPATIKNFDLILIHSLYSFPAFAGGTLARLYHKPYLIIPHGALEPVLRAKNRIIKDIYHFIYANKMLSKADSIIFNHEYDRKESNIDNLKARSVIIPLGFNNIAFIGQKKKGEFRRKFLSGYQGPLVLFLGRLNLKKGVDLLIDAFAKVMIKNQDCLLVLVGNADPSSYQEQVKTWIHNNKLEDNVILTGPLYGEDKINAYSDADIFVMPSLSENFGYTLFEAMASRIPVIVSDTVSYSQEVSNSKAGIVIRRNSEDFALAILQLLSNKDMRISMGENGRRLTQNYSWDAFGKKFDRLARAILSHNPLPDDLDPK
jgi:glycosyltransferase involved in cell wall biosynthesis